MTNNMKREGILKRRAVLYKLEVEIGQKQICQIAKRYRSCNYN